MGRRSLPHSSTRVPLSLAPLFIPPLQVTSQPPVLTLFRSPSPRPTPSTTPLSPRPYRSWSRRLHRLLPGRTRRASSMGRRSRPHSSMRQRRSRVLLSTPQLQAPFLPPVPILFRSPSLRPTPSTTPLSPRPYRSWSRRLHRLLPGRTRRASSMGRRSRPHSSMRQRRSRVLLSTLQLQAAFLPPVPILFRSPSLRPTPSTTRLSRRQFKLSSPRPHQ